MLVAYPVPRASGDEVAEDIAAAASIRRHEERLAKDPASLAFAPLADLYRKAGRAREAVTLCRDGLGRFPGYGTARLILAKALADDGDAPGALAEVQVILDASPADVPAHRLAADLHRRAGRLAEAVPHLRQVTALDPADRESRMMLDVLCGAGVPSEGSPLRALLADNTFVTKTFGDACLAQGLVDEAAQIFVRLLRKEPGDARARERLDEALRIKTQRRKGP
jgi:tetratricopeptide (TPR) repeat protein